MCKSVAPEDSLSATRPLLGLMKFLINEGILDGGKLKSFLAPVLVEDGFPAATKAMLDPNLEIAAPSARRFQPYERHSPIGRDCFPKTSIRAIPGSSGTCACGERVAAPYFRSIGGAIFSGGAGGRAAFAPSFCACASGRAGSGAGVVGRVPPGFASAGLSFVVAEGEPCRGGVACARRTLVRVVVTTEKPQSTSPAASIVDAKMRSARSFLSFDNIAFTHE